MVIETFICPVSSISNPDEFNTFLLRNQKMMPLSSVGISSVQQEEYYIVFGALSLKSSLEDILLEITSLVDNALDLAEITEEYSGNDSNLLIVFYVQIMPDDFVMQLHRF